MNSLKDLIITAGDNGQYEKQAKLFIEATKIEIVKTYIGTKPHFITETTARDVYNIIIKRGNKHMSFEYGDSIHNTEENRNRGTRKTPSNYDILCSLERSEPEDNIDDFAGNFGIEKPSEAVRIYNAVKKSWHEVSDMFTAEEIEALAEIN
jgi:putative transposon-encoded protein